MLIELFKRIFLPVTVIVFLFPLTLHAQINDELRLNIFRSKVTGGTENSFFNTFAFGVEYQRELFKNFNGVAGVRFVQIMGPDKKILPFNEIFKRDSKSFLTFDLGAALIPITIEQQFQVRFGIGASVRHRHEVFPVIATKTDNFIVPVLVFNDYQNEWDIGGFFNLEFTYIFNNNWLIAARSQFHTFDDADGVFDVGLSLGKKF